MMVLDLDTHGVWVLPHGVAVSSGRLVALAEQVRRAIAIAVRAQGQQQHNTAGAQAPKG